jgi:drug/metabolite transporter (DMT)-like permease
MLLQRGTAARATANFYLMPRTAALMAWALLGETLSPLAVTGLAVSSLGCWLMSNRRWGTASRATGRRPPTGSAR